MLCWHQQLFCLSLKILVETKFQWRHYTPQNYRGENNINTHNNDNNDNNRFEIITFKYPAKMWLTKMNFLGKKNENIFTWSMSNDQNHLRFSVNVKSLRFKHQKSDSLSPCFILSHSNFSICGKWTEFQIKLKIGLEWISSKANKLYLLSVKS